eukprot:CAMPEP_0201658422 /NCGR_PEP_ID=MMETSP0494-20130426/1301_1 /ASSEMBLY_ACC=CAM_ASM_000839 /TAXON_ID=420259 /ORGANISM="Thalassiosira gravida, Strain GMp14c1" /LENGTH=348 /DNA_ID=CAMNT_0048135407 /DNA_START=52 /DNA_END=1098 /DNA_ORIENTATION=+
MKTSQPFRRCHLQILRSLYVGQNVVIAHEHQGNGALLLLDAAGEHGDATVDKNRANECERTKNNATAKHGGEDGSNNTEESAEGNDAEGLVDNEIWGLIERFLQRRSEYRPHKERRIHWEKINVEAQSRLDHLASITSSIDEENSMVPMQSRSSSSLTPRTPLFSMSGRVGSMTTPSQSLTPQSSNRNAPRLSETERELASTVPSWNFMSQMLRRRSKLCTESCRSFRSQPFLAELRNEAELRCAILGRVLKFLKIGTPRKQERCGKKRDMPTTRTSKGKRQKLEMEVTGASIPSSLEHFFSNEYTKLTNHDLDVENCIDEDSIMVTQMKLCLWSLLLSSVKEIVDES